MIALALATLFAPAPAETLTPSSGWSVDYAQYGCTLSRSFGTGDDLVTLALTPQTAGNRLRITLISKREDRFPARGKVRLGMGDGVIADAVNERYSSIVDPGKGRVATFRTGRDLLEPLGRAKALTVQLDDSNVTLALASSSMAAPLKALADCEQDLAKGWGFDLTATATQPVPTGWPQRWLTNDDYPAAALREKLSGETGLLVIVDAEGKPQRCAVTDSSGSTLLDQTSCALILKRGQFRPATGKDGKPIAAPWATSFRWELPMGGA